MIHPAAPPTQQRPNKSYDHRVVGYRVYIPNLRSRSALGKSKTLPFDLRHRHSGGEAPCAPCTATAQNPTFLCAILRGHIPANLLTTDFTDQPFRYPCYPCYRSILRCENARWFKSGKAHRRAHRGNRDQRQLIAGVLLTLRFSVCFVVESRIACWMHDGGGRFGETSPTLGAEAARTRSPARRGNAGTEACATARAASLTSVSLQRFQSPVSNIRLRFPDFSLQPSAFRLQPSVFALRRTRGGSCRTRAPALRGYARGRRPRDCFPTTRQARAARRGRSR